MESKKAIEYLNNTVSVGEFVFSEMENRKPFNVQIAELIQHQDKIIDCMFNALVKSTSCPITKVFRFDCGNNAKDATKFYKNCSDCWRKYLQSEVEK